MKVENIKEEIKGTICYLFHRKVKISKDPFKVKTKTFKMVIDSSKKCYKCNNTFIDYHWKNI